MRKPIEILFRSTSPEPTSPNSPYQHHQTGLFGPSSPYQYTNQTSSPSSRKTSSPNGARAGSPVSPPASPNIHRDAFTFEIF